jgi:hypothetical protein
LSFALANRQNNRAIVSLRHKVLAIYSFDHLATLFSDEDKDRNELLQVNFHFNKNNKLRKLGVDRLSCASIKQTKSLLKVTGTLPAV